MNKKVLLRLQLYRGYSEMDDFWMEENVLETPADFSGGVGEGGRENTTGIVTDFYS